MIHQKEKLGSLIEELSELLNDLDRVQPADVTVLTPICDDEASKLLENERLRQASVAMLEDAPGKLDGRLADAIARHKAKVSASARRNSPRSVLRSQQANAEGRVTNNNQHSRGINIGSTLHGDQTSHVNFI